MGLLKMEIHGYVAWPVHFDFIGRPMFPVSLIDSTADECHPGRLQFLIPYP